MHNASFTPFSHIREIVCTTSVVNDGPIKNEFGFNQPALNAFAKRNSFSASQMVFMKQIHSRNVAIVSDNSEKEIQDVDGLITDKKNLFLSVLTADCLPIVFFDPTKNVIGAVHAGYKGLLKGVIQNIIEKLRLEFAVDSKKLLVGIGPAIGKCCYSIDPLRVEEFRRLLPAHHEIITQRDGEFFLDLGMVAEVLLASGNIPSQHITNSHICTKDAADTYFSYRRGNNQQRMVSVIGMI